jgi:Arc/MetJ-type ribon-helix-helix transcriptional regulator
MSAPTTETGEERLTALVESYRLLPEAMQRMLAAQAQIMREHDARQAESAARLEEMHAAQLAANNTLSDENARLLREVESTRAESTKMKQEFAALRADHEVLMQEREAAEILVGAFEQYRVKKQAADAAANRAACRGDPTSSAPCEITSLDSLNEQSPEPSVPTGSHVSEASVAIEAGTEHELVEAPAGVAVRQEETVFTLPSDLLESIDRLVDAGNFASRSIFARVALAEAIEARVPAAERQSCAGTKSVRRRKETLTETPPVPG